MAVKIDLSAAENDERFGKSGLQAWEAWPTQPGLGRGRGGVVLCVLPPLPFLSTLVGLHRQFQIWTKAWEFVKELWFPWSALSSPFPSPPPTTQSTP